MKIGATVTMEHNLTCYICFRLLSDPESLDRYLLDAGFEQVFHTQPTPVPVSNASRFVFDRSITPQPDAGLYHCHFPY